MRMRLHNGPLVGTALIVAVTIGGCGDGKSSDEPSAPAPPAAAGDRATDAHAPADADASAKSQTNQDQAARDTPEAGDGTPEANASGAADDDELSDQQWQEALATIHELERDARFRDALRRVEQLKTRDRDRRERFRQLAELNRRLTEHRRSAVGLSHAIEQLDSQRPELRRVARRKLLGGGETGRIYLRRAAREGSDQAARIAVECLAQLRDKQAIDIYLSRYAGEPGTELAAAMVGALTASADRLTAEQVNALARRMLQRQAADPAAEPTTGLMALLTEAADRVSPDSWAHAFRLVQQDQDFEQLELVDWLESAYHRVCRSDDDAFDALVGHDDATEALNAYVRRAGGSASDAVAAWALHDITAFRPYDQGAWGEYYRGHRFGTLSGEAKIEAFDLSTRDFPFVDYQHLSVKWRARLRVPRDGVYTIYATFAHGFTLVIDGRKLINHRDTGSERTRQVEVELEAGLHPLAIDYFRRGGAGHLKLEWSGPGLERTVVGGNHLLCSPAPPSKRRDLADVES